MLDSLGVRKDSDERLESKIEDNNIVKKLNEKAQNDQGEYWLYKDIFITSFGMDFLKCVIG